MDRDVREDEIEKALVSEERRELIQRLTDALKERDQARTFREVT